MSKTERSKALPLAGVRVVDLTHVIAGPYASQILADLGADVVKIEESRNGDAGRHLAPFVGDQSHYFSCFNRNKRSVALDLKQPEGRGVAMRLIEKADILVENFAPGALARLGLGYEEARRANPAIIYCSISGFGHTGPVRNRRYYDLIGQAYSGVMSTNGERGGPPIKVGIPIGDTTGSLFSVVAILAAWSLRQTTGEGQHIDMALQDCLLAVLANYGGYYLATGAQPERVGSGHYFSYPYGCYEVADGYVVLATSTDEQWQRFCTALDLPDFAADPKLATREGRAAHREQTDFELGRRLKTMPQASVIARLDEAGIPCGPVNDLDAALNSEQAKARGMVRSVAHPAYGQSRLVGSPLGKLARNETTPPPLLGEHSVATMRELGYADAEIERLLKAGAVVAPSAEYAT